MKLSCSLNVRFSCLLESGNTYWKAWYSVQLLLSQQVRPQDILRPIAESYQLRYHQQRERWRGIPYSWGSTLSGLYASKRLWPISGKVVLSSPIKRDNRSNSGWRESCTRDRSTNDLTNSLRKSLPWVCNSPKHFHWTIFWQLCFRVPVILPYNSKFVFENNKTCGPRPGPDEWCGFLELTHQHGPACRIGPPYVYAVDVNSPIEEIFKVIDKAISTPIQP